MKKKKAERSGAERQSSFLLSFSLAFRCSFLFLCFKQQQRKRSPHVRVEEKNPQHVINSSIKENVLSPLNLLQIPPATKKRKNNADKKSAFFLFFLYQSSPASLIEWSGSASRPTSLRSRSDSSPCRRRSGPLTRLLDSSRTWSSRPSRGWGR